MSSKQLKQRRNDFILGSDPETEESDVEDDVDSGFSPSPDKDMSDITDSSPAQSCAVAPPDVPRLVSRHNVISRRDNLILSPEVDPCLSMSSAANVSPTTAQLSPNSMAARCFILIC